VSAEAVPGAPRSFVEVARAAGRTVPGSGRAVVCVQGLGFVGAAMAIAVAMARGRDGTPLYDVIGVDLPTESGRKRVDALNRARFPFETTDLRMGEALREAHAAGNLVACTEPAVYALASVVLVDIHLDVDWDRQPPRLAWEGFRRGITQLASQVAPGALVIVETTVPPGTIAKVVAPIFAEQLAARGIAPETVKLAHSYERVMPGREYLDSIVNYWRVYAGHTPEAGDACETFLSSVLHTDRFPLTRLGNTTSSELAKVLENAYRATIMAFMEEWGRFGEAVGVDLFEVAEAIRLRPTHSNLRTPGFGVGGYCLTKDPLFGALAARDLFGLENEFPFSTLAVETNQRTPRVTVDRVQTLLGGSLAGKTLLLLGVSYRQDVGDTRYSPSETFVREARARGAAVIPHDPLVGHWDEMNEAVARDLPPTAGVDAIVFAVPHREYRALDLRAWLAGRTPAIFDAFSVLTRDQREALRALGCRVESIGRGKDQ